MKEQVVFDRKEYQKKVEQVDIGLRLLYEDIHLKLVLNLRNIDDETARKLCSQAFEQYQKFLSEFALKGEAEK